MMAFCSECGSELPPGAKFCANCGTALDPGAASSPDQSQSQPSPLAGDRLAPPPSGFGTAAQPVAAASRGGIGLILPIMVAIAVVIIGYLVMTSGGGKDRIGADQTQTADESKGGSGSVAGVGSRGGDSTVAQADDAASRALGSPTFVSASTLDTAFFNDPAAARERYTTPLRVSGTIATMVQPGPTPALALEGRNRFNYMIVNFPEGYRTRLTPLMKGQFISVTCDEVTSLGGTTILSGCLLV